MEMEEKMIEVTLNSYTDLVERFLFVKKELTMDPSAPASEPAENFKMKCESFCEQEVKRIREGYRNKLEGRERFAFIRLIL